MNGNLAQYVIDSLMQNKGLALPRDLPMVPDLQLLENIDGMEAQPVMTSQNPNLSILEQTGKSFLPGKSPMGGPAVGDISNKIQEWLGAKQPDEGNFPQQALSKRFEQGPSFSDYSRAIQASAYGKPTNAQDFTDAGLKQQLDMLGQMQPKENSFDQLVSTYMSLPDNDPRKAIYAERLRKETTPASFGVPIPVYNSKTKQLEYATPEQITGGGYQPPKAAPALGPTQQKEIFDAADVISSSQSAKDALIRAKGLMKEESPFSGFGAETRAAANRVPGIGMLVDDERAAATTEYNTLIREQALGNMKAIFGGNPTEGERQVLLQMQALASYTPEEQSRIIDNAIRAIDKRINFNQLKIQAIESGDIGSLGNMSNTGGWSAEEIP